MEQECSVAEATERQNGRRLGYRNLAAMRRQADPLRTRSLRAWLPKEELGVLCDRLARLDATEWQAPWFSAKWAGYDVHLALSADYRVLGGDGRNATKCYTIELQLLADQMMIVRHVQKSTHAPSGEEAPAHQPALFKLYGIIQQKFIEEEDAEQEWMRRSAEHTSARPLEEV